MVNLSSAHEAMLMEQASQTAKLLETASIVREANLREQAEAVGFDTHSWQMILEQDPKLAERMLSDALQRQAVGNHRAHRTRMRPTDAGYEPSLGEFGTDRIQKAIDAGVAGEDIARTLIPDDKRDTHVVVYDMPAPDGVVYNWSVVPKGLARIKIDNRSKSALPLGPLDPGPQLLCGADLGFGRKCTKKLRTPKDVRNHKLNKHGDLYQMEQQEAQRLRHEADDEDRRLDREERRAILDLLKRGGVALQAPEEPRYVDAPLSELPGVNGPTPSATLSRPRGRPRLQSPKGDADAEGEGGLEG